MKRHFLVGCAIDLLKVGLDVRKGVDSHAKQPQVVLRRVQVRPGTGEVYTI